MAMVDVDDSSVQADSRPSKAALSEVQRPLGALLFLSNELSEVLQ